MKFLKITIFVLLVLNILVPAFQSCSKDSSKTENPTLQLTMENLVNSYNKDVTFEHEKAVFLEGEMTIMTLPSKEVLFFLKKEGSNINEVFLGQGTDLSSMIQKELGKVKVAYLREALGIETEDGAIYTFTIGERKGHDIIQKLTPAWTGKGYGLTYNYGRDLGPSDFKGLSSTDELREPTPSSCKCRVSGSSDSDCASGGAGSTSCSIGATTAANGTTVDPGCTVSCGTSAGGVVYYACCKAYVE